MLEALCRPSSTILDIVHAEDGPPITQRTSGLGEALAPFRDQVVIATKFGFLDAVDARLGQPP